MRALGVPFCLCCAHDADRPAQVDVKPDWLHLNGESTEDFTMSLPQMEKLKAEDEPRARTLGAFVCACRRLQARASHACSKPSR